MKIYIGTNCFVRYLPVLKIKADKESGIIFDCQIGLFILRMGIAIFRRSIMALGALFSGADQKGKNSMVCSGFFRLN